MKEIGKDIELQDIPAHCLVGFKNSRGTTKGFAAQTASDKWTAIAIDNYCFNGGKPYLNRVSDSSSNSDGILTLIERHSVYTWYYFDNFKEFFEFLQPDDI